MRPTSRSRRLTGSSQEEGERRVLSRLGYLLGRWVYLCDALDDIGEDIAKKRYNPFVLRSGAPNGLPLDRLREEAVFSLNLTMGAAAPL